MSGVVFVLWDWMGCMRKAWMKKCYSSINIRSKTIPLYPTVRTSAARDDDFTIHIGPTATVVTTIPQVLSGS